MLLYGSESWTLGASEVRKIQSFELWCYRRMLKIRCTDRVTNEEVLRRMGTTPCLLKMTKQRRHRWIGHILRHDSLLATILEGTLEGRNYRGRPRLNFVTQLVQDLGCKCYVELKRLAQDREMWKRRSAANQPPG